MGSNCSCLRKTDSKELKLFSNLENLEENQLDSLTLADLITLQGVLRGYLERRRTIKIFSFMFTQAVAKQKRESQTIPQKSAEVPDYDSLVSRAKIKLPPFVYEDEDESTVVAKGPLSVDNNAVYLSLIHI